MPVFESVDCSSQLAAFGISIKAIDGSAEVVMASTKGLEHLAGLDQRGGEVAFGSDQH